MNLKDISLDELKNEVAEREAIKTRRVKIRIHTDRGGYCGVCKNDRNHICIDGGDTYFCDACCDRVVEAYEEMVARRTKKDS